MYSLFNEKCSQNTMSHKYHLCCLQCHTLIPIKKIATNSKHFRVMTFNMNQLDAVFASDASVSVLLNLIVPTIT